jgi:hypothetical protein
MDRMPAEAESMWLCYGGAVTRCILGVFTTRAKADTYAEAANEWYGADHPLCPIRVEEVKVDIRPFPSAALARLRDADDPESREDALTDLFVDLALDMPAMPDEVPEAQEDALTERYLDMPDPAPRRGGRSR